MNISETKISSEMIYRGKIINLRRDTVKLPDGNVALREVVEHPGGVCVLAITDDKKILCVRQFRAGIGEELLEIPAGKLEKNEDVRECGLRELREETGYETSYFEKIGEFFLSPGYTGEKIYLYLAKGLKFTQKKPDDDEFLEIEQFTIDELKKMVQNNTIKDAKTVIAIMWASQYIN